MVTIDTNIAIYAFERQGLKPARAKDILESVQFVSVQVLNEYAHASRRKFRRNWGEIGEDLEILCDLIPEIHAINASANRDASRIADRYQLQFYDALMIAVALQHGATTLYSEDMQHGLVIEDTLTITNPFLPTEPQ